MVSVTRIAAAAAACLCALLLAASALAQGAGITARIDNNRIGLNDSVTLEVRAEVPGRIRFGLPESTDFEVISQATSTSQRFDQTGSYSVVTRILRMRPLRAGALTVGRVAVETARGTVYTEAFPVEVSETAPQAPPARIAPQAPAPPQRLPPVPAPAVAALDPSALPNAPSARTDAWAWGDVGDVRPGEPFVVARVSRVDPVVGEQFIVEYLLCSPITSFGLSLVGATQPEFTGVWFRDVSEQRIDRRSLGSQRINNDMYEVNVLSSYIVVPLREGELIVPSFSVELAVDSVVQARRFTSHRSVPVAISARTPPLEGRPNAFREPNVGRFDLKVDVDRTTARVGDAIAVTLRANGAGLMSRVVLPALPDIANTRIIVQNDRSNEEFGRSGWLEGFASRSLTLIAEAEGTIEIPALSLPFWDPFTNTWRTATSEPQTLVIAGVSPEPAAPALADEEALDHWSDTLPSARVVSDRTTVANTRFWRRPWYLAAMLLPPLVFAGATLGTAAARRVRAGRDSRRSADIGRAVLRDLAALDVSATDLPAHVVALTHEYLGTRLERPTKGLTRPALRNVARERLSPAADALVDVLDAAERGRYGEQVDGAALVRQALAAVEKTEEAAR